MWMFTQKPIIPAPPHHGTDKTITITAKKISVGFGSPQAPRVGTRENVPDTRKTGGFFGTEKTHGPTRYAPNQSSKSAYEAELLANRPAHRITGSMKHNASLPYQRLDYSLRSYRTASARCGLTFHSSPNQRSRDRARSTGAWTRAFAPSRYTAVAITRSRRCRSVSPIHALARSMAS